MKAGRANARKAQDGMHQTRRRMIIAFILIVLMFAVLVVNLGLIQIVNNDYYAGMAAENVTRDELIPPRRGSIVDRNLTELAVSTVSYRIFVRLKQPNDAKTDPKVEEAQRAAAADVLSEVLGMARDEVLSKMDADTSRVRIARDVNRDQMALIAAAVADRDITIIEAEADSKRNYPLGAFAAHVLGTVDADGGGQNGIELEYDRYLSGIAGRRIMNADGRGDPLNVGEHTTYEQEDGLSIVLTIDETIQYYVEEAILEALTNTGADQVTGIVMDPKNGDILAMANYPEFDPNSARVPLGEEALAEFQSLSESEQTEYLMRMWRNPAVSNLYEPGSVFKLVTISSGFETGAITPETPVYCGGGYQVADRFIKCWSYPKGHGSQTVRGAVSNSCNPAMMQVIEKIGYDRFYQYLELFGMTAKTGIDLPGEAAPWVQNKQKSGSVGLATMSFGMGINITPIEMVSAVAAIGNDGVLMKPRLVRGLADSNGKLVEEFQSKIVRQVVSEQTAAEVKAIMNYVSESSGVLVASVPGYHIGTKTGTAQKLIDGQYSTSEVIGSMVAVAPIDNPRFVVIVVVDNPRIGEYGVSTAGPAVRKITEETLRYMNVKPAYTDEELARQESERVEVPDLSNRSVNEAESILLSIGLQHSVQGGSQGSDFVVIDQYPKPGTRISPGGTVYLYGS